MKRFAIKAEAKSECGNHLQNANGIFQDKNEGDARMAMLGVLPKMAILPSKGKVRLIWEIVAVEEIGTKPAMIALAFGHLETLDHH